MILVSGNSRVTKFFSNDTVMLLPDPVRRFIELVQYVSDRSIARTRKDIISELEEVEGFIEVPEKKQEIAERFAQALIESADMKMIVARCEELIRPGVLPEFGKNNNDHVDEESSVD